jgi:hypothetical protein
MLSCILSDTLEFRSPTTTDRTGVAEKLAADLGIDIPSYAAEMFAAKSDVSAFSDAELLRMDSKEYEVGGTKFRVSVLETTSPETVLARKDSLMETMPTVAAEDGVDQVLLFVVDILREESTLLIPNDLVKTGGREELRHRLRRHVVFCRASSAARSRSSRTSRSDPGVQNSSEFCQGFSFGDSRAVTEIIQSLADVSDRYDALFCDLWGCVHDGVTRLPRGRRGPARLQGGRRHGGAGHQRARPRASVARQLDKSGRARRIAGT